MRKHAEAIISVICLLILYVAIYWTYTEGKECREKGGIYIAQQSMCIKAEVI